MELCGWLKSKEIEGFLKMNNLGEGFFSGVTFESLCVDSKESIPYLNATLQTLKTMQNITSFVLSSSDAGNFCLRRPDKYIIHYDVDLTPKEVLNVSGVLNVIVETCHLPAKIINGLLVICNKMLFRELISQGYYGKHTITLCNQQNGSITTLNRVTFATQKMEESAAEEGGHIAFKCGLYSVEKNGLISFLCFNQLTGKMLFMKNSPSIKRDLFRILEITELYPGDATVDMLADAMHQMQMCPQLLNLCRFVNSNLASGMNCL